MKNILFTLALLLSFSLFGQNITLNSSDSFVYKETTERTLKVFMFKPQGWKLGMNHPSIIFYFGGGLTNRYLNQLEVLAKKFSSKGYVSFVVDYRVKSTESVTAIECITDAQDSFSFIRKNASAFAIDENKITAFGYSSGGYLSAALGTLIDKKNNSLSKPNSIILLAMGEPSQYKSSKWLGTNDINSVSTIYNIDKNTPSSLLFIGEEDPLLKYSIEFNRKMIENKNFSELILFKDNGHRYQMRNKTDKYFNLIFDTSLEFLNNQFFVE
jgi:acetyl esterase